MGGFNPIGIGSVVFGFAVYVYLLDPVSYETSPLFSILAASIPAAVLSGAVHGIVTTVVSRHSTWGGYRTDRPAPEPEKVAA